MKTTWETSESRQEQTRRPLLGSRRVVSAVALVSATLAFGATTMTPAAAGGREVIHRGNCSGSADWKLKAKADDGRIEVEGEVDSNVNGQNWRWRILHNGDVSARGTGTTHAPSGSFSVERRIVDSAGTDQIGWRARNPSSGQVCRGSLQF